MSNRSARRVGRQLGPVLVLGCVLVAAVSPAARAAEGFGQITGPGGCLVESGTPASAGCGAGEGIFHPRALAVSPDGTNVYVVGGVAGANVSQSFGAIAILKRNPATGEVTDGGCLSSDGTDGRDGASGICTPTPALLGADGVAVSPDGHTVFVSASASGSVVAFAREPASGALTRLGCLQMTPRPGSPCTAANLFVGSDDPLSSPTGSTLYLASPLEGAISAFTAPAEAPPAQTTEVTPPVLPPRPTLASLFAAAPQPFMGNPCIATNGDDGVCAVGVAMKGVQALTLGPEGKQLYAAATSSGAIDVFSTGSAGELTQTGCIMVAAPPGLCAASRFLSSPTQLAISPDGRNLYAADRGNSGGKIDVLARDASSGQLSDVGCVDYLPPPPTPEGGEENEGPPEEESEKEPPDPCTSVQGLESVSTIALNADGTQLYAFGESSAVSFSRDPATGMLTETSCASESDSRCARIADLTGVEAAAVSPDGRNVYVVTNNAKALLAFGVGAAVTGNAARASRRGAAFVPVACPARLRRACRGRVILMRALRRRGRRGHRARVVRIAVGRSAPFAIAAGSHATVAVRLQPSARGLLRSRRRLRVTAVVRAERYSGGSGMGRSLLLRLPR